MHVPHDNSNQEYDDDPDTVDFQEKKKLPGGIIVDADTVDFQEKMKMPRGNPSWKRKRASSSPKDTQDSTSAKAGSPPSTDTEEACAHKRKINTKHNWVSVRKDDDGGPLQFEGFSPAYAFMHQEFAVKGCNGMTLVDRGGDTTKYCVVYRYACAFHNYIKCPFLVRIRVLVLPVSLLSLSVSLPLFSAA